MTSPLDHIPLFSQALCAETDPEIWFPYQGGRAAEAKALCQQCPERVACLEWALTHNERFGVWGGLSERERRQLTTRRRPGRPRGVVERDPRRRRPMTDSRRAQLDAARTARWQQHRQAS